MNNLFSLTRIWQNPRKIVFESLLSKPLPHGRPTLHGHGHRGYHTSPLPLQRPPNKFLMKKLYPFKGLQHHNAYLKPKLSSNVLEQFRFQSRRFIQCNQRISYRRPHYKGILATHAVLIGLFVTNLAVFLLWKVADTKFMRQNFTLQLDNFKSGQFHTMITNAFSHFEGSHFFLNMLSLCVFGKTDFLPFSLGIGVSLNTKVSPHVAVFVVLYIGETFGPRVLLKLYLAGAFVGSAFCLVHKAFLALQPKENNGLNKHDPSKAAIHGASAALKPIMLLHFILYARENIHNQFGRAILMGICIFGSDMITFMSLKEKKEYFTLSSLFFNMGGVAVAVIAWTRLKKRVF